MLKIESRRGQKAEKLKLTKETLRRLGERELEVVGGASGRHAVCNSNAAGCVSDCCTTQVAE
jgi:hypothetical protein